MAPYGTNWVVNLYDTSKAKTANSTDTAKADVAQARGSTSSAASNAVQ